MRKIKRKEGKFSYSFGLIIYFLDISLGSEIFGHLAKNVLDNTEK